MEFNPELPENPLPEETQSGFLFDIPRKVDLLPLPIEFPTDFEIPRDFTFNIRTETIDEFPPYREKFYRRDYPTRIIDQRGGYGSRGIYDNYFNENNTPEEYSPYKPKEVSESILQNLKLTSFNERKKIYDNDTTINNLGRFALNSVVNYEEYRRESTFDDIVASRISLEEINRRVEERAQEERRQKRALQRAAHTFRSKRMRLGAMGGLAATLQEQASAGLKAVVARMTSRADQLNDKTTTDPDLEMHRLYAPLISGYMVTPEGRKLFMDSLDSAAKEDSDALKAEAKQGTLEADYVIVGSGVQAAVFAAKLRALKPDASVVVIGQEGKLGGQFRKYGERPTFRINSRAHRRQDVTQKRALPGQAGNLNPFGEEAPLQITDVCSETYPTNIDMGNTAAINLFLSARTMLNATYTDTKKNEDGEFAYTVNVTDDETNEPMQVKGNIIVSFPGLGERSDPFGVVDDRYMQAEEFLSEFGDPDNPFPMEKFIGKRVAVIGSGDTGRITTELLTRLGPKEAYAQSIVQLGSGPDEIVWYGADDESKKGYLQVNRPRYAQVATFIAERGQDFACKISADPSRAGAVQVVNGDLTVVNADGKSEVFDYVINTTSFINTALDPFDSLDGVPEPVYGSVTTVSDVVQVGVKVAGPQTLFFSRIKDGVFIAGPAAGSPLSNREKQSFADGITENTAALWANTPRTETLARLLTRR